MFLGLSSWGPEFSASVLLTSLLPGCKLAPSFLLQISHRVLKLVVPPQMEDNAFSTLGVFLGLCPLACGCAIHSTGFETHDWICSLFQSSASSEHNEESIDRSESDISQHLHTSRAQSRGK